jgi:hypothetical protein
VPHKSLNEEALRTAFTVSVLQRHARSLNTAELVTGIAHASTGGGLGDDPRLGYLFGRDNASEGSPSGQDDGNGTDGEGAAFGDRGGGREATGGVRA